MIDLTLKPASSADGGDGFTEAKTIDQILKDEALFNKDAKLSDKGKSAANLLDTAGKKTIGAVVNSRSIVSRARNSVLQFPIYMTQSIRIAEAHTIGKAFERVYASFVQSVVAQNPVITNLDDVNNLKFLKQYHTNVKEPSMSVSGAISSVLNEYYQPIDEFDRILTEGLFYEETIEGVGTVSFSICQPDLYLARESARMAHEPLEGFRYLQEASATVSTSTKTTKSSKDEKVERHISDEELSKFVPADSTLDEIKTKIKSGTVLNLSNGSAITYRINEKDGKTVEFIMTKTKKNTVGSTEITDSTMRPVDPPTFIKDADVKKINGMNPFNMAVTFRVRPTDKDGKAEQPFDHTFVIGVKTIMHIIQVKDLAEDLREIVSGSQKTLQKVRYKTGEISWLKDYLLNIKGLKADAAKNLGNKRWLNTLKRLGEYEKMNGSLLKKGIETLAGGNVPIPNGTIVLSKGDISRLKDDTGINLEEISNARSLAKSLFLIGVVIVDGTAGTMKVFFPDIDTDWDVQSLGALDSDIAKIDNSPLMNEINRISRK